MNNLICERCKEHKAVVFVNTQDGKNMHGYCLSCAKELGLSPINNILDKMGITDDQIDNMYDQLQQLSGDNTDFLNMLKDDTDEDGYPKDEDDDTSDDDEDEEDNSDYIHGAPAFPFRNFIFGRGNDSSADKNSGSSGSSKGSNSQSDAKKSKLDKKYKHLNTYCENLTIKAEENKIDNIVGRDNEITRAIQILCRRTKNNPCLIGEPGVGKTAIAEGLAQRIAKGDVPYKLKNKQIYLLDLTALVAGTQFRGQFEARVKGLISEIKAHGDVILFIDEVHNLVGTGDSEGTMNAANMLKPALSRGELQVIGATTLREYRKFIERDTALERRFQPITVSEPSIEETVKVLVGIKSYYETFHHVTVSDAVVRRAVVLSERYITDRFLPDKAIDLLDEACVNASLRNKKLNDFLKANDIITDLSKKEDELLGDDDIDYAKISQIRTELAKMNKVMNTFTDEDKTAVVTIEDIAKVVEVWTGIPASKIQENELKRLSGLETKFKQKVIGQDEAVEALASAIKRSRVQISPRRHPASFIFVGPTGVGKTELVKVMSAELFDSPETLIRLDMSEFMEKHSVSKIIGSPPGYVGYDEAGQVTEKVRRRPYSVLLFDEIEKAHPDVLNILLQILDEGRLTDAHGRVVNFENTVIVMTSNAGSDSQAGIVGFNKSANDLSREKTMKALSDFLRPEFLARVDEVICFNTLNEDNYKDIAKLLMGEYVESLKERGITFTFDDKAAAYIAAKSIGGKSGARDLRNNIRRDVEDAITNKIIEEGEGSFTTISLTADDDKLIISTDSSVSLKKD